MAIFAENKKSNSKMFHKATKLFVFLLILTLSCQVYGQVTFEKTLNFGGTGEIATAATENLAGNFVVAGNSFLGGNSDVVIFEMTPAGTTVSSLKLGTASSEIPNVIFQSADSNYIIAGTVYDNSNNYDWFLMKLDASFNPVWYKRFGTAGNDLANSCYEISPGHYLVTGTTAVSSSAQPTSIVFDSSGVILPQGYLNTNQFASPNYRGKYLGNGMIGFSNLKTALSVMDTTGAALKHSPVSFCTYTRDCEMAPAGAFAMTGVFALGSPTGHSVAFGIIDSAVQNMTLTVDFKKSGFNMTPVAMYRNATTGNYFIAGSEESISTSNEQPFILETDVNGVLQSSYKIAPAGLTNCGLKFMTPLSNGGFLVGGFSQAGSFSSFFVASLNPDGTNCASVPISLTSNQAGLFGNNGHAASTGSLPMLIDTVPGTAVVVPTDNLLCLTTGIVHTTNLTFDFMVYPAMVGDHFYVEPDAGNREFTIRVYDISGRKVKEQSVTGKSEIDAMDLESGIYMVLVYDQNSSNPVFSTKVIKAGQ
jgi:hypothetical protein